MKNKFQKKILIVFSQLELRQGFYTVIIRYMKQSLTASQNLYLFYQQ